MGEPPDDAFRRLNASVAFDWRLAPYDIDQSRAHARMLSSIGVLSQEELERIEEGLSIIADEFHGDAFSFQAEDEDVHMAIERRLIEKVGGLGGRLHTARSRNDQVATDVAMFVRAHSLRAVELLRALLSTLVELAEGHEDWPMPGYTHLQRAQPVYLAHHLLAYFWMFKRDARRFEFVLGATEQMPLGSGALAGVNWEIDRPAVAKELGFSELSANSIDAVSNRDFVLDYLGAAATCAMHLSRLGAEIVLFSSEEFGFCEVADSWASTSSIMPQKKNPDAAELLRAKAPRIAADLSTLLGVMHGLPLAYNKDLQEDKEPLFDAVDSLELCLRAADGMLAGISFDRERLAAAADDEFLAATDLADMLVRKGVTFRQAHEIVARIVRHALEHGKRLSELSRRELAKFSDVIDREYHDILGQGEWLESKVSAGGTASARVAEQLEAARDALDQFDA